MNQDSKILIQRIENEELRAKKLSLNILRLDLIDIITGGNKHYKLKYNLEEAKNTGHDTLLTFGGAFSNHIAATASMGKKNKLKTIGVIRGEQPNELSHTLKEAQQNGMNLVFWSREKYKNKTGYENLLELENSFGRFYLIPEGGSNRLAVKGCAEILNKVNEGGDIVCTPVGTGGTLAGIVHSLNENQKALGFSALKEGSFLKEDVLTLLHSFEGKKFDRVAAENKFDIITGFDFGGYAKYNHELLGFMRDFNTRYNIPLDFVYTGKMMFGLFKLIEQNYFANGANILAIHTGGLQGNEGLVGK